MVVSVVTVLLFSTLSPTILGIVFHPNSGLIAIYFWSVATPYLMPVWAVFLLGLLQDMFMGFPLGTSSFILLLCSILIKYKQHMINQKEWSVMWGGFAIICLIAHSVYWGLTSLYHQSVLPVSDILASMGITFLLYPLLQMFYSALYHWLFPRQAKSIGISR